MPIHSPNRPSSMATGIFRSKSARKLLHFRDVVEHPGIHRDDRHLIAIGSEDLPQARHLDPARNAVGRPDLQIYRPLPIEVRQVDRLSVDGFQRERWRGFADKLRQYGIFRDIARVVR